MLLPNAMSEKQFFLNSSEFWLGWLLYSKHSVHNLKLCVQKFNAEQQNRVWQLDVFTIWFQTSGLKISWKRETCWSSLLSFATGLWEQLSSPKFFLPLLTWPSGYLSKAKFPRFFSEVFFYLVYETEPLKPIIWN